MLTNIKQVDPTILIDLKYATKDNFTKQILYPFSKCLAIEEVANSLAIIQQKLKKNKLGIKVWDAYRPLSIQQKLWDLIKDERYVSHPNKSRHTRGTAIDLTLVDEQGKDLIMPTMFDDFSTKAHRHYMKLPKEAIENRMFLEAIMKEHHFIGLETEWWHFDWIKWQDYPIIDIDPTEDY